MKTTGDCSSLLATKARRRFVKHRLCDSFHLVTTTILQEPLAYWSGNTPFPLIINDCHMVASQPLGLCDRVIVLMSSHIVHVASQLGRLCGRIKWFMKYVSGNYENKTTQFPLFTATVGCHILFKMIISKNLCPLSLRLCVDTYVCTFIPKFKLVHVSLPFRFLSLVGGSVDQIGSASLKQCVESKVKTSSVEELARTVDTTPETLRLIIDGLTLPPGFDIRQSKTHTDILISTHF